MKIKPNIQKWKEIVDNKLKALCAVRCTYATIYLKNDEGVYIRAFSFQKRFTLNNAIINYIPQADLYSDSDVDYEALSDLYNVNAIHRGFLTEYAIKHLQQKVPHDPVLQQITTKTPIYFRPCAVLFEKNGKFSLLGLIIAGGVLSYLLDKKKK